MPDVQGEYVPGLWTGPQRTDRKPLHITRPEGVSFTVEGTELRWQNWSMRLGFNYREGPVLYQVAYHDHAKVRDIAYGMSFAEMVVPYRDSSFDHYRRTAYDIGEWGLRLRERRRWSSAATAWASRSRTSTPSSTTARASRTRSPTRSASTRRTTRSSGSTSTPCTGQRYEGCAGSLSRSTARWPTTSISSTGASTRTATSSARYAPREIMGNYPERLPAGRGPRTGTVVDNRTYAPFHQRFIVARLDLDVDGEENTVLEVDSEALGFGRQPLRPGPSRQREAGPFGGRGGPGLQLGAAADVEGGEPQSHQPAGCQYGVQDRPWRIVPRDVGPGDRAVPAVARDRAHAVGHPGTMSTSAGPPAHTPRSRSAMRV